jgi:hypothetical protein
MGIAQHIQTQPTSKFKQPLFIHPTANLFNDYLEVFTLPHIHILSGVHSNFFWLRLQPNLKIQVRVLSEDSPVTARTESVDSPRTVRGQLGTYY